MSLRLDGISKQVGADMHIHPTDLELAPGITVLIGQTLAGKTTLMRLMAGLDQPSGGRILVDGVDVTGVPVQKRGVAMVYQQFINYPSFTVYENIASPLRLAKLDSAEIDRKVREVAEMMHIEEHLQKLPAALSGGQQQRTAMARALVKDAGLLLFDEPLVNLDYKLREQLRAEMRDIFIRRRAIMVYATTEPLEALALGGQCAVLDEGRVLQTGSTLHTYHNPASVRVGEVFSDPPINVIDGEVRDGEIHLDGGALRLPLAGSVADLAAGRYRFGVRANHLALHATASDDAAVDAEVELAELSGSETFIHVAHHGVSWVVQEEGVHSVQLGEKLRVYFNPRHLFAFDRNGRLVASPQRALSA